ncbi:hypothetical protein DITRI_Ditri05aG0129500 [Diplodiscus trichospermus]
MEEDDKAQMVDEEQIEEEAIKMEVEQPTEQDRQEPVDDCFNSMQMEPSSRQVVNKLRKAPEGSVLMVVLYFAAGLAVTFCIIDNKLSSAPAAMQRPGYDACPGPTFLGPLVL